ncbi:MAG: hypothetical protein GY862_28085 [Gammaproteobacteria bacterium]|nr:hypothetical protein [Gammaproteobacteria bacterium]
MAKINNVKQRGSEKKVFSFNLNKKLVKQVAAVFPGESQDVSVETALRMALAASCPAEEDLGFFASSVLKAAAAVPKARRYEESKVFIFAAWLAYIGKPSVKGLNIFKFKLVECSGLGLLHLRSIEPELLEEMEPMLVQRSATKTDSGLFHFIEI